MSNYESFVVAVTGASRGIGLALCKALLEDGHIVSGCSRSDTKLSHPNYSHHICDLSDTKAARKFIRGIRKDHKRLDVLINNAAINPSISPVAITSEKSLRDAFDVNFFSPFILCSEAVKIMQRQQFGRILNMGSMATKHEVPGEAVYTSAKASLQVLTRILAKESGSSGVTVNMLSPAAIPTELSAKINQVELQKVLDRNALKSYGEVGDVVRATRWLISRDASSITGQTLFLGGA